MSPLFVWCEWVCWRRDLDLVIAVQFQERELTAASRNELARQVLMSVLADIKRQQYRERFVSSLVSLVQHRLEDTIESIPRLCGVSCDSHSSGRAKHRQNRPFNGWRQLND
jgi:hypothetical protein